MMAVVVVVVVVEEGGLRPQPGGFVQRGRSVAA